MVAQLFGIEKAGIANIYKEGELQLETTVALIATIANRGVRGEIEEQIQGRNINFIIIYLKTTKL